MYFMLKSIYGVITSHSKLPSSFMMNEAHHLQCAGDCWMQSHT